LDIEEKEEEDRGESSVNGGDLDDFDMEEDH
jgi:hypothetical protein